MSRKGTKQQLAHPAHQSGAVPGSEVGASWTFLSNHGHVLVTISRDPSLRLRDIATAVGITERGAQKIVSELEHAGFVEKTREGRRNRYVVNLHARLRHPLEDHATVGDLLSVTATP